MKKSILFVLPALGMGGAEKSIVDLFRVFDFEKYEVDLLLLCGRGLLESQIDKRVCIRDSEERTRACLNNIGEAIPYFKSQQDYFSIAKKIILSLLSKFDRYLPSKKAGLLWKCVGGSIPDFQRKQYDIAVAYLQGVSEYYVADKVTAVKKIFWMHTSFRAHANNDAFEKRYIDKFNKVVCVSQAAKDDFIQLFPEKSADTTVFYNIVDEKSILDKSLEPLDIEIDSSMTNIVSVGRLHVAKAYDVAIPAFKKVNEKYPDTRFYIVGTGPEESNLKSLIKKYELGGKCILLGRRMNPYNIIKACDIFLQSSRYEGYCIALAEAKILQKPIVTTDFYGAFEQIVNEENGLIVKCDEREIEHALCRLIGSPQLCQQLVGNLGSAYKRDYQAEFENIIN